MIAAQEQDLELLFNSNSPVYDRISNFNNSNCYHDPNHLSKVDVLSVFLVLSMILIPMTPAPQRSRCVRHNIHGPWIVDSVYFRSCFILNYVNITSTLSHFTVDSSRFLDPLTSRNYLPVLLVSIVLLNSSQLANHVVEDEYTYNIIYWDEQHQMLYSWSCLFMYFFTQGSSITLRDICFSVPIGLQMTEPEWFHCAGIYTFVQRTIFFEQIEYQPWHLNSTQISSDNTDTRKYLSSQ